MKKSTKLIILLVPVLMGIAVFTVIKIIQTNEYYSHPVYYTYDKGNNHQSFVTADGIEYKAGCTLDSNQVGDMIGFLDDKTCPIYRIKNDINKNFLYVTPPSEFRGAYLGYYRSDFVFPEASADTINKMEWWDSTCHSTKTITDQDIINELFEETSKTEQRVTIDYKNEVVCQFAQIQLYVKEYPGLCYYIYFDVRKDGSFICDLPGRDDYCTKISSDLLERIAGHKFNLEEEINSIIKSEKNLSKYNR